VDFDLFIFKDRVVSHIQTFRLTAEGLDFISAFIGQELQ